MASVLSAFLAVNLLRRGYSEVFLFLAFCFAGAFVYSTTKDLSPDRIKMILDTGQIASGEPVELEGILDGKPEPTVDGYFLDLRVEKIVHDSAARAARGRVKLFASSQNEQVASDYSAMELQYGTRIRLACVLEREERFQNPGVMSQKQILDQQGVDATGTIKSPLLIEVVGRESVFIPLAWVYDQRQEMIYLFRRSLNASTSGILIASLLGDRHFLDKHTADIFREGGTFHVLVISGLHITFIGGLILLLLRRFTRNRFWPSLLTIILLWLYALAVGADVPVVRATTMFTVLVLSQILNRKGTLLNGLGFCALLILAWRPEDLFSASFQLTFVSVAAIVVMAFPLIENLRAIGSWTPTTQRPIPPNTRPWLIQVCEILYWREEVWEIERKRHVWSTRLFKTAKPRWFLRESIRKIGAYIFEAVLVSATVQIWLMPFLIIYFHRISIASVLLNLWVGLSIALESFAAVTGLILSKVAPVIAAPFFRLTEIFNWFLVSVPGWIVDGGWASFRLPAYTGPARIVYVLYAIPVGFLAYATFTWKPFALLNQRRSSVHGPAAISLIILVSMIIFHPFSSPRPSGKLRVDFLDVGQGDSALITFPDGETLLVDGGGRPAFGHGSDEEEPFEPDSQRIGEAVVSEFLWEKGYSKIDYILATHADADHIQGLTDVAKNFGVKYAFFGRTPANDPDFIELATILQKRRIPYTTVSRGDKINVGGASVQFLYPEPDESTSAVSDNDHSVVLRVVYGARKFLLTGDIEKAAESNLLKNADLLISDVVKVPHHGSRTSSMEAFVTAVKPQFAVISVGKQSPFGHPNAEVVERWQASGSTVLITGQQGTISVSTDGRDLQVQTFVSKEQQ